MRLDERHIVKSLLNGMYLMKRKNHEDKPGYKLYSGKMNPEMFIPDKVIRDLDTGEFPIFKTDARQKITLNLTNVRRLHGNHLVSKLYKRHLKQRYEAPADGAYCD